eukprot:TRINITY_DN5177_c0_g1_i1.p1 TRINITY_DN5177_c0_g1~~TRINITY_DN5177_c0_g1_i1.p1  ORF type:complete len:228 (+),score=43.27 TRINITY_DN5177_c0_g1_i1:90-773(+)
MSLPDKASRYIAQWDGKDKIVKLGQYTARLLAYMALHAPMDKKRAANYATQLTKMEASFSDARRAFRLGGIVREYNNYLNLSPKRNPDLYWFEEIQVYAAMVMECLEFVIWASKIKIMTLHPRWIKLSDSMWLVRLVYALTLTFSQLSTLKRKTLSHLTDKDNGRHASQHLAEYEQQRRMLVLSVVRILADMAVCVSGIIERSHKGFTAACGVVSSIIGIYQGWKKL